MTKIPARFAVLVTVPVLVAALAGCEDPTKDMPKATVSSAAPAKTAAMTSKPMETAKAPMPAPAGGETLALDPTSSVLGFVGSKVTGKHEGKFTTFTGSITLAGGKPEGGKIMVEIDLSSVKTDQDKLNGHLKSKDFFDVEKFPKATFTSTEIKAGGEKGATDTITGELDLHGMKKTISFPATIAVTPDGATGTAEFSINRKDFGLVYPGKPDDLIRDDVGIKLSLKATRKK